MAIKSSSKKTLILRAPEATLVLDEFVTGGVDWLDVPEAWVREEGCRFIVEVYCISEELR